MSRVLIPLTEGFEESEAIVPADLLVRAEIEAVFVGMTGSSVTGSHGITVSCNGSKPTYDMSRVYPPVLSKTTL